MGVRLSWKFLFFFFQAEDGIRDDLVTGVQTCALPICLNRAQEIIREWEVENRRTSQLTRKSTQEAWKEFLADVEARKLNDSTARKYKLLNRQMEEFAQRREIGRASCRERV